LSKYPPVNNFSPTSISFVRWNGIDILNTRFVNYDILPDGRYYIKHPQHHLHTRNMSCSLYGNEKNMSNFREIFQSFGELEDHGQNIYGLEDLRLYVNRDNSLCFIASNKNHIKDGKIKIVRGIYDIQNNVCRNLCVISSPTDCWCEKNWIPIPDYNKGVDDDKYDYFIYKWEPFEIGRVLRNTDGIEEKMEIILSIPNWTPRFTNVRGSSNFIETPEGWMGVVHLSEEHSPRHYYHMLVLLDKETFLPLKYSRTFVFHKHSIEFCMGFDCSGNRYRFWFSNYDRDPEYLEILKGFILLDYTFNLRK
jgi:hypothetical protein